MCISYLYINTFLDFHPSHLKLRLGEQGITTDGQLLC